MILRLSSPAARGSFALLGLALLAAFAYSGVRTSLADHYAGLSNLQSIERAARLEPSNAQTWYLLGRYWQYNLDEPDAEKAIAAYQKSLSIDPHSADAWSDLAMAYESENKLDAARDAFLRAKRAYPLSPEVAWRFGNFLLRRGEFDAAFAQIKQAVQVEPKRGAAAFALSMRVDPDIKEVLDRALPASQAAYLSVIASLAGTDHTDQALVVWDRLMALQPRPRLVLSDSNNLIEALLQKRQMAEAERVWNEALNASGTSRPPDPPGSLIWDGGFESSILNDGFTWRFPLPGGPVQVGFDAREKHSGQRSLRLTFNGLRNIDFHDVCQYIPVQPSATYQFSAWVQTRSLSTDEGVRFSFHSLSDSTNTIVWTDDARETHSWTQLQLLWTAGADVRELILCISRVPSKQFDSKIRGSAWIDDVSLSPTTPTPTESSKQ
jgi:tetratricopeptide (TPR) repeat protein